MTPRDRNMAVIDYIAFWHGVSSAKDILGSDQRDHVCLARSDCARHFRAQNRSLPEIGRILKRHHTTIINMIAGKRRDREYQKARCNVQYTTRNNAGIKTANDNAHSRAGARDCA